MDFVIEWRIMRQSEYGSRRHNKRKVDKHLFRALVQFWNPAYSCFTFRRVDLVPTVEEYMALLRCLKIQVDKAYSKATNVTAFVKNLVNITRMSEQWVASRIKQKGDSKCIPWKNLRDLILAHPDMKERVDIFALGIYGLVVFPKALGHVDEAISDLFDRLDKRVTPILAILEETFRSLNACRKAAEGRFIGCAQLLLTWFHSHFWKVEKMILNEILYHCGDFDWVPLLRVWGAVGYAPLLVLRQYRLKQFVPATQGLAQCEFSYKDDNYRKKFCEMSNAWKQTRRMKGFTMGLMMTPEYDRWWGKRINDNILMPS
ncbi:hypothetical protein CXB51_004299 [Gossypium anomalum]|uniref:DUF7745 domain-containing protein n=1 Tax=Gossypium anomalum TaxID=47600 RepID=A0A8J5Z5H6_9ROSI|nr:hypothetical protein CXB51_004299 [Gossypium anomalum]